MRSTNFFQYLNKKTEALEDLADNQPEVSTLSEVSSLTDQLLLYLYLCLISNQNKALTDQVIEKETTIHDLKEQENKLKINLEQFKTDCLKNYNEYKQKLIDEFSHITYNFLQAVSHNLIEINKPEIILKELKKLLTIINYSKEIVIETSSEFTEILTNHFTDLTIIEQPNDSCEIKLHLNKFGYVEVNIDEAVTQTIEQLKNQLNGKSNERQLA